MLNDFFHVSSLDIKLKNISTVSICQSLAFIIRQNKIKDYPYKSKEMEIYKARK